MQLYLIQHGAAVPETEDQDRPLSAIGVEEVNRTAAFVAANWRVDVSTAIFHSGKTRARQTAEIFAKVLKLPDPESSDDLKPMDKPGAWRERLMESEVDLALVGHLPHLSRLAALLLAGDKDLDIVRFRMGGVVALAREPDGWILQWMMVPEIIP